MIFLIFQCSSFYYGFLTPLKSSLPSPLNGNKPENRVDNFPRCPRTNLHTVFRMSVCPEWPVAIRGPFGRGAKVTRALRSCPSKSKYTSPFPGHIHIHILIETTGSEWCKPLAVVQSCRRAQNSTIWAWFMNQMPSGQLEMINRCQQLSNGFICEG